MKLTQFIQHLSDFSMEFGNVDVILASDEEGNSYENFSDMSMEYISSDHYPDVRKALILWPVKSDEIYMEVEVTD